MATEGVDYAGSRPDPAKLFAAGKRFVVRYGGPGGSWKHLTATEARSLIGAGLAIVANAEGTASGLRGRAAGADWARSADAHFRSLGMPANRPIYLSADWDVTASQWPSVAEALRGAASVIGAARVGIYGGRNAIRWARQDRVAAWYWQTYAWSGGVWVAGNHLEQYRNGVSLAGGDVDLCRAKVADYGQWGQGTQPQEDDVQADERAWTHNSSSMAASRARMLDTAPILKNDGKTFDKPLVLGDVRMLKALDAKVAATLTAIGQVDENTASALRAEFDQIDQAVGQVPDNTVAKLAEAPAGEAAQTILAALGRDRAEALMEALVAALEPAV